MAFWEQHLQCMMNASIVLEVSKLVASERRRRGCYWKFFDISNISNISTGDVSTVKKGSFSRYRFWCHWSLMRISLTVPRVRAIAQRSPRLLHVFFLHTKAMLFLPFTLKQSFTPKQSTSEPSHPSTTPTSPTLFLARLTRLRLRQRRTASRRGCMRLCSACRCVFAARGS